MIANMFDGGALQVLERTTQFTAQRHKVLVNNIANMDTPYYKPRDLSPDSFRATLAEAVDRRREQTNPTRGPLEMRDSAQLRFRPDGMNPVGTQANHNLLFHDENNRDLERTMQHLAENTLAHNAAVDMIRNQFDMLRTAIRGQL